MNTRIYSVFPACGKTYLYEHQEDYGVTILDSDSSKFSWIYTDKDEWGEDLEGFRRLRNPDFPNNYIKHIKENIGKYDCIFVSSHASVREALDKEGIDFTIVYPEISCKAEWIGRCFLREKNGESGCGPEAMCDNWEQWISECIETGVKHKKIILHSKEHLSSICENTMEGDRDAVSFDLRDMIADEVKYRKLDPSIIDKAVLYIKNRSKLLEVLDYVVDEGIRAVCAEFGLEAD